MSKPNQLIDAVKTATDIHNGDYSSLRGKYFVTRDKIKENNHHHGDKHVKKSRIDRLEERIDQFEGRFDRIEESIANLAKEMRNGFKQVNNRIDNLEKDVNARIDQIDVRINQIDTRLDYIVKANNLKDSK